VNQNNIQKSSKRLFLSLLLELTFYGGLLILKMFFESDVWGDDKVLMYSILAYTFIKLFYLSLWEDYKNHLLKLSVLFSVILLFVCTFIFEGYMNANSIIFFSFPFYSIIMFWLFSIFKGSKIRLLLGFLSLNESGQRTTGVYDILFSIVEFISLIGWLIFYFRV